MAASPLLTDALPLYQHYRTNEAGFSPRTWAGEKAGLLSFLDGMHQRGRHVFRELTDDDIAEWWTSERARLKPSTQATRVSQLRSFFRHAQRRGWLDADVDLTWRIDLKKPKPAPRERLTASELLSLLDAAEEPRDRLVIAVGANLGLRASDMQTIRMRHVHLDNQEVEVYIDKTGEPVVMPLSSDLIEELETWFDVYPQHARVTREAFLVPSRWTGPKSVRYTPDRPQQQLHRVVQRVLLTAVSSGVIDPGAWAELKPWGWTLNPGEGVHTIRRSAARLMFDAAQTDKGFDEALLATMAFLNHANPQRTLDYIGVSRRAQALDHVLKGKPFLTRLADRPAMVLRIAQ